MRSVALVSLISVTLVAGCPGDEGGGDADTGAPPDTSTMPVVRASPAPPTLPDLGPCPDGWRAVAMADGGPDVCEPYPETGLASCADHEAHFPGTPGCQRIGTECPADGWPSDLPASGVVYARSGATGGTGSRDMPFGTIGEAIDASAAGETVAVAAGEYDEEVSIPDGISLRGACAELTVVSSEVSSISAGVITAVGPDASVSNLSIRDSARPGLFVVGDGRSLTATDVVIAGVTAAGVSAEDGARFDGERIVVRRVALYDGLFGFGLNTERGASSQVRWVHVEGAAEFGITANLAGSDVTVEDAVVADVTGRDDGTRGFGLIASTGASMTARRVVSLRANEIGVASMGAGTSFVMESSVVRDVRQVGMRTDLGRGIVAQDGSSILLSKVLIERAIVLGLYIADRVDARLEDVVVRDIVPVVGGTFGRGIDLQGSTLSAERIYVRNVHEVAVSVSVATASADLSDVTIRDVAVGVDGLFGRGLVAQEGAMLNVTRADVSHVIETGVAALDRAHLEATDLFVHDVASRLEDGVGGWGIASYLNARATIRNSIVADVRQVGVVVLGEASEAHLDAVEIARVAPPDCAGSTCVFGESGHAFAAYATSRITATNFRVHDLHLCGIHVAEGGTALLSDGEVTNAAIGACVQNEAQRIEDLQTEVAYRDNGMNLQATNLPVPDDLPGGS